MSLAMDQNDCLPAKFLKVLPHERCMIDAMCLPPMFCDKYGDSIPSNVTIILRNGDEINLKFNREVGAFVGMRQLFERFNCHDGCILVFQYNGTDNFWVHVITSAIEEYGDIEDDSGCKFVRIIISHSVQWGKIILPHAFVERFGHIIPKQVTFLLKNGDRESGTFDEGQGVLLGMQETFKKLCLSLLDTLLFTYHGDGVFDVSAFNGGCVEKAVRDKTLLLGGQIDCFEILIKPSHLLQYCYGVYIAAKFRLLTNKWKKSDHINISHGTLSWRLKIRKRQRRAEIHSGWSTLVRELSLSCGDVCFFKRLKTCRSFEIHIYRRT